MTLCRGIKQEGMELLQNRGRLYPNAINLYLWMVQLRLPPASTLPLFLSMRFRIDLIPIFPIMIFLCEGDPMTPVSGLVRRSQHVPSAGNQRNGSSQNNDIMALEGLDSIDVYLVGGFNHVLLSISYMGCHPSH